ncbi:MAG: GNAT family N-acetyltransferase [Candidatus Thorarchaeota archaeon]
MEGGFKIEPLNHKDLEEIANLMKQVFGTSRTQDYSLWKYEQAPPNQVLIVKDSITSKIVSFNALIPWPIILDAEVFDAVQSVDGVVHPQFRRRGIWYNLCNEICRRGAENGFTYLIGWAERYAPAWRAYIGKLGWMDIGIMQVFAYPIKPFRAVRWLEWGRLKSLVVGTVLWFRKLMKHPRSVMAEGLVVEKGRWDYDGFWRCWKESQKRGGAAIYKDPSFYRRRFMKSPWPQHEFYPISVRKNDKIVCFAICIVYASELGIGGVIADLQCIEGHENALKLLLKECIEYFEAEGAEYARGWAKKPDWILETLVNLGFIIRDGRECFLIYPLSDDVKTDPRFLDFNLWDLNLCDSDHV